MMSLRLLLHISIYIKGSSISGVGNPYRFYCKGHIRDVIVHGSSSSSSNHPHQDQYKERGFLSRMDIPECW